MKYDDTPIAKKYDSARKIPENTMALWMNTIRAKVPLECVSMVIDAGCGTGRFSAALADLFDASVLGVDPSETMLAQARKNVRHKRVAFKKGSAESLPVKNAAACIVFMSMVYHHIERPERAAREFLRVLRPGGVVCIRTSTLEFLDTVPYLKYFPKALEINRSRIPSKRSIIEKMENAGLSLLSHNIVRQEFADTMRQYYEKISQRTLSDLVMLSDAEFKAGIKKMKQDVEKRNDTGRIKEPIDLFVFKKGAAAHCGGAEVIAGVLNE